VNLSPDKKAVLQEAYRVLTVKETSRILATKAMKLGLKRMLYVCVFILFILIWACIGIQVGGEFYFSDIYCNQPVPEAVQKDKVLWGMLCNSPF